MFKKKKIFTSLAVFLIAYAPIVAANSWSTWVIGEPKLPNKMLKEDDQLLN